MQGALHGRHCPVGQAPLSCPLPRSSVRLLSQNFKAHLRASQPEATSRSLRKGERRCAAGSHCVLGPRVAVCRAAGSAVVGGSASTALKDSRGDASDEDTRGPAFHATLAMLEWPRLKQHVATFTNTAVGRAQINEMVVPESQKESEQLVADTQAMIVLQQEYAVSLDFGGIDSALAKSSLFRASRGGPLSGKELMAVVSVINGGDRLRAAINAAVRQATLDGRPEALAPLQAVIKGWVAHKDVTNTLNSSLYEGGEIKDSASEDVRRARARINTLKNRLKGLLQNQAGEATEQGGRVCLAVPAQDANRPGCMLLGAAPGVAYIEPAAAVPHNNELEIARSELETAENQVLWNLSSLVIDAAETLTQVLDLVVRLDVIMAKTRYGDWIEGCLPTFVPFSFAFHRGQGGSAAKSGRKGKRLAAEVAEDEEQLYIQMKRLRHPLLLGDYLRHCEKLGRDRPSAPRGAKRVTAVKAAPKKVHRRLSNRKDDATIAKLTSQSGEEEKQEDGGPVNPVPIDMFVRPEVRSVIITGPNTGGKTAALKALGLSVLMARCGLPVPAEHPVRLPPFTQVLADLGDEQSLSASLSTFSGHLRRIQALRGEATGKELILLDEVGTGTEPVEGAALGIALLRTLARGGLGGAAITFSTTHHRGATRPTDGFRVVATDPTLSGRDHGFFRDIDWSFEPEDLFCLLGKVFQHEAITTAQVSAHAPPLVSGAFSATCVHHPILPFHLSQLHNIENSARHYLANCSQICLCGR
mmetsp:Transcript_17496/g.52525  ORF Transcript_17496/g.52525 Transcript_17496/m.52525 type:complete len:757 (+) Transcript_17496:125-2395(+)